MAEDNVAVLIDFENVGSQDHMRALLDELSGVGRIVVKRAFGDWNKADTRNQQQLQILGIELIHHFQTTVGKNASDIKLTAEAVDLLHTSSVEINTFVIASSDSDFFPLVTFLRSQGKSVFVAGRKEVTTEMLVNSCDRFIDLQDLVRTNDGTEKGSNEIASDSPNERPRHSENIHNNDATKRPSGHLNKDLEVHQVVIRAIRSAMDNEGQVKGAKLHETVRRIDPSFDFRDHGYVSFSSFLGDVPNVKVKRPNGPGDITVIVA